MFSSILVFLVVLSVLVLVHEIGHFVAAKRAGIWVEEFGFGLPPRIFGKKIGETIYSINFLPFGGFVRLHGESSEEKIKKPKRAFINKSRKTRIVILLAGVIMNFVLAIVAFTIVYSFSGIPKATKDVKIVDVAAESPAQTAGILVGDIVRRVDGTKVTSVDQFVRKIEDKKGEKVVMEVQRVRGGKESIETISVKPREEHPEDEGPLGVVVTSIEIYYPPTWQRPFLGIYYGFQDALFWGVAVVSGIFQMLKGLFVGQIPQDIAGPVGIFAVTTQAAQMGTLAVVNFVGILSVNLAILNIIPFPALDGGRLLFIGIESVLGRKILPKVESTIHTIGMIILLLLLVAITAQDIRRLISAGSISGFLDSVLK